MEVLLGKVTQQAMNYAIRSGIALTANYAILHGKKVLANAPKSDIKDEVYALQLRLERKVRIVSPAIDMIELIVARGNTSLESALGLAKDVRFEIQSLGRRLESAARASESNTRTSQLSAPAKMQHELELKGIATDMKALISRIEDAIPLLNLAITTSGVSLSTNLPHTISPSRLLQASTLLTAGDSQYAKTPHQAVQIGPTFTLSVYMLFAGHNRPQTEEEIRETTWKEVMHKARVKLRRVPIDVVLGTGSGSDAVPAASISSSARPVHTDTDIPADSRSDEFGYQLMIVEDLDDDRVHDFEEGQPRPGPFDDIDLAGVREMVPIHQVSKIFYADTSKVLNIGTDADANHPVLLLKRDMDAVPPRKLMDRATDDESIAAAANREGEDFRTSMTSEHKDPWRLPPSLDPEWIALEVFTSDDNSDTESSTADADVTDTSLNGLQPTPSLDEDINRLHISSPSPSARSPGQVPSSSPNAQDLPLSTSQHSQLTTTAPPPWASHIITSLSLLELLLRLTSLQQFQQQSHLTITDELLNFFLEESATTGAGGNEQVRQGLRADARRRVGWDPYDESPIKRRGEEYQYGPGSADGWSSPAPSARPTPDRGPSYNDGWDPSPRPASVRSSSSASGFQTRSMARVSDSPVPSPDHPAAGKGREQWLRRDSGRGKNVGSPLRPSTGRSDEGLGTSPVSGVGGIEGVKSP